MKDFYSLFFLVTIFLLLIFRTAYSQTPAIQWQKSLGGTGDELSNAIIQTHDGGYLVAGESDSNDGDVTGNHGSNDEWIVKLDASGNVQWQKSYGGSIYDRAFCIRQTMDDGYVTAGVSSSSNGDVTLNHGSLDYWIVKIDSAGNLQWQKSLGGSGWDLASSVQQSSDSGYILVGYCQSIDGDVIGHHGLTVNDDCWIIKLDANGNVEWKKTLGGSNDDSGASVVQTSDGGYAVVGSTSSTDGDVIANHGGSDYWIIKMGSSGNIEWQKSIGGSLNESASSIEQTGDGGYIVSGTSNSNDGDVTGNHGGSDFWIVKLDMAGNIQWQKSLGGTAGESYGFATQGNNAGFIITGYSLSSNGDVSGNHGGWDYWTVAVNTNGDIQWQKCLGGTNADYGTALFATSDGGCVVAGTCLSNDGDVTGNHGNSDYWVVKLAPYVGLQENNFSASVSLFPNPTKGNVQITFTSYSEKFTCLVFNILGEKVFKDSFSTSLIGGKTYATMDLSFLSKGVYCLRITSASGSASTLLTIE